VTRSSLLWHLPRESPASTQSQQSIAQVPGTRGWKKRGQVHILDRSYYPNFYFQIVSVTDAAADGIRRAISKQARAGWAQDRSKGRRTDRDFSGVDTFAIRSRKSRESANERAEKLAYDQDPAGSDGELRKAKASSRGGSSSRREYSRGHWTTRGITEKAGTRSRTRRSSRLERLPTRKACGTSGKGRALPVCGLAGTSCSSPPRQGD